ncbi:WxL domain-containing protein [Candidatus Enterococcus mansonii]|uniref:WxL domain-containing protein n=1 Tax=Candidatus Enterococcus mansonii TaxID=1834181 RepID=A0A242CC02_9ENTE|nr:WxL domain-containing protein [Enterococcus sp. 4G2_DIV0659]OTO07777.1 hypothetical protein A5880_002047 [Enterococcus sp. 4G2_DIV0659]
MREKQKTLLLIVPFLLIVLFNDSVSAYAETARQGIENIQFEGGYPKVPKDPEQPGNEVNPGDSPSTNGELRIDFVPQFEFWKNETTSTDAVYFGNAQLFHGNVGARGNFVQVSDYRGTGKGWTLQIRQEMQFKNDDTKNKELNGAVISLDQSWASSTRNKEEAPIVQKDVIRIDNIGQTYNLAEAKPGSGEGTWAITFGASAENGYGRKETLKPRLDKEGNPVMDPNFENKPMYQNEALTLSIPEATKKDPVTYNTVITWILSELP